MTRRPRVLVVGPTPPPYLGPAVNTQALLAHGALRERFDVLHLDTSDRRDISNSARFDATNVRLALRHGAKYLAMLARHRPDLVYLPISPSRLGLMRDLQFLLPAVARGCALVIHQRGGQMQRLYATSDPLTRAALRYVFARVSRVIVLGECFRPDFANLIAEDRIVVVPNGSDPALFRGRESPPPPPRPARVLYMGFLMEAKGYRDLLEVARRLRGMITLHLAGEYMNDAERSFTERFIEEHGLADTVELLGVVSGDSKIAAFKRADIFAFPSAYRWEGQPTAIIEAMAAGLPIVSTRHVAIPETLTDGEDGFLVNVGDVEALTARIRMLATDAPLRIRLGQHARETMLRRFTIDRCVESIVAVFESALQVQR